MPRRISNTEPENRITISSVGNAMPLAINCRALSRYGESVLSTNSLA
jgi:hypothetical protein